MVEHVDDEAALGSDAGDQPLLENDLKQVARRTIEELFTEGKDKLKLSVLPRIVQVLHPEDWTTDKRKTEAVRTTIRDAIEMLPRHRKIPDTDIAWYDAAMLIFGFTPLGAAVERQLENVHGDYNQRVQRLEDIAKYRKSHRQFERAVTPSIRRELAFRLREMEELHNIPVEAESPTLEADYVPRPKIQHAVTAAFKQGKNVVLLHGDAGTGKSKLARAIASLVQKDHSDIDSLILDGRTEDDLNTSLDLFMERHAPKVAADNFMRLRRRFQELLASNSAPRIVILDNIQSVNTLSALLPGSPHCLVVVTSRNKFESELIKHTVPVENMQPDEARQLVARNSPNASAEEIPVLAEVLGYRPLAIVHGCACLPGSPFHGDVARFCSALPVALEGYVKNDELTLNAIYKITIDQLAAYPSSDSILRVLDLILIFGPGFVDLKEFMTLAYTTALEHIHDEDSCRKDAVRLLSALKVMEDRSLIRVNELGVMHDLTADIMREIRKKSLRQSIKEAIFILNERLALNRWPGGCPSPQAWPFLGLQFAHLRRSMFAIYGSRFVGSEDEAEALDHLTAIMLRQFREHGILNSIWIMEILPQVYAGLPRPQTRLRVGPLWSEVCELDMLPVDVDIATLLPSFGIEESVWSHLPMFKATLASVFRPLTSTGSVGPNTGPQVRVVTVWADPGDWRIEFQFQLYSAVMDIHGARWNAAKVGLERCLEIIEGILPIHPEAYILKLACYQRFMELGMYSKNNAMSMAGAFMASKVGDETRRSENRGDELLSKRFLQKLWEFEIETCLTGEPAGHMGYLTQFIDRLREQRRVFLKWGLGMPALECTFTALRAEARLSQNWTNMAMTFLKNGEQLRKDSNNIRVGSAIFALSGAKLLISEDRQVLDSLKITTLISNLADVFWGNGCYYWHADALNTLYAAELRLARSNELIDKACEEAKGALESVNRQDKLSWAEYVGERPREAQVLLWY